MMSADALTHLDDATNHCEDSALWMALVEESVRLAGQDDFSAEAVELVRMATELKTRIRVLKARIVGRQHATVCPQREADEPALRRQLQAA